MILCAAGSDSVNGFSTMTFLPAAKAAMVYSAWNSSLVSTKTTSTAGSVMIWCGSLVAVGMWNLEAQCCATGNEMSHMLMIW